MRHLRTFAPLAIAVSPGRARLRLRGGPELQPAPRSRPPRSTDSSRGRPRPRRSPTSRGGRSRRTRSSRRSSARRSPTTSTCAWPPPGWPRPARSTASRSRSCSPRWASPPATRRSRSRGSPSPRRARPPARPTRTAAPASRSRGRSTSSAASAAEKEAAFAAYLATEQGQRAALVTLVADVASTYLLLRQLDLQLEVARRTLKANDETVRFYEARLKGGVSNRLEVDQAVANRARTATVIPQLERQIAVAENALCLLLGRLPGPIERGAALVGRARAAGGSRRPAGLAPRAAAGRARGRAAPGRGQRQRGRGQGPLLPHDLAHRPPGHDQRRLLEPPEGRLQRLAGEPEPLRADLPGREDQAQLRGLEGPLRPGPGGVPEGGAQRLPGGRGRARHASRSSARPASSSRTASTPCATPARWPAPATTPASPTTSRS